jgi:hypothetical protein
MLARGEAQACAIVLDASAARTRHVDLRRPAERLDSLLRVSAAGTLADDVGRLILARLLVRMGDRRDALAALRRRPYLYGLPGYVATSLREEAALAERTRDRRGALTAWRRFATLRAGADPPLKADVARAWLEVRRLEAR